MQSNSKSKNASVFWRRRAPPHPVPLSKAETRSYNSSSKRSQSTEKANGSRRSASLGAAVCVPKTENRYLDCSRANRLSKPMTDSVVRKTPVTSPVYIEDRCMHQDIRLTGPAPNESATRRSKTFKIETEPFHVVSSHERQSIVISDFNRARTSIRRQDFTSKNFV